MDTPNRKHSTQNESKNIQIDNYEFELKEWIQHVINTAEKKGDTTKLNQFIALKAEIIQ